MRQSEVPHEILAQFNGLLIPCFFSREWPDTVDVIGVWKFAQKFYKKNDSLEDRREWFHLILDRLDPSCLNSVYEALRQAQQDQIRAYLEGFRIDNARDFNHDREKAVTGLKNLRRFLEDCDNRNYESVLAEIEAVIDDHGWPGPRRRSRAGHQPEPWLKEARKELARLKIPKELREDLLSAVGLIPERISAAAA